MTITWCLVPEIVNATDRFFCHFGRVFALLPPLKPRKIDILKKWKKHLEILSLYTSVIKIMITCCNVPEIWRVTDVTVTFHFRLFFALLQPKKSKFQKNEKSTWIYHHFTHVYQKFWLDDARFLRYGGRQTDERTDGLTEGRKKWHTEVGAPPKKC